MSGASGARGDPGNTKRISASKRWCLTLNNPLKEEVKWMEHELKNSGAKFWIGKVMSNGPKELDR